MTIDWREFIKSAGIAGMVAGSCSSASADTYGDPQQGSRGDEFAKQLWQLEEPRNAGPRKVIVILGESVRNDMLNCNRRTGLKTPNLDRLAQQGIRFARGYNCQPVCAPV